METTTENQNQSKCRDVKSSANAHIYKTTPSVKAQDLCGRGREKSVRAGRLWSLFSDCVSDPLKTKFTLMS